MQNKKERVFGLGADGTLTTTDVNFTSYDSNGQKKQHVVFDKNHTTKELLAANAVGITAVQYKEDMIKNITSTGTSESKFYDIANFINQGRDEMRSIVDGSELQMIDQDLVKASKEIGLDLSLNTDITVGKLYDLARKGFESRTPVVNSLATNTLVPFITQIKVDTSIIETVGFDGMNALPLKQILGGLDQIYIQRFFNGGTSWVPIKSFQEQIPTTTTLTSQDIALSKRYFAHKDEYNRMDQSLYDYAATGSVGGILAMKAQIVAQTWMQTYDQICMLGDAAFPDYKDAVGGYGLLNMPADPAKNNITEQAFAKTFAAYATANEGTKLILEFQKFLKEYGETFYFNKKYQIKSIVISKEFEKACNFYEDNAGFFKDRVKDARTFFDMFPETKGATIHMDQAASTAGAGGAPMIMLVGDDPKGLNYFTLCEPVSKQTDSWFGNIEERSYFSMTAPCIAAGDYLVRITGF